MLVNVSIVYMYRDPRINFFSENFSYILNSTRMGKNYLGNKDNNFFNYKFLLYFFVSGLALITEANFHCNICVSEVLHRA